MKYTVWFRAVEKSFVTVEASTKEIAIEKASRQWYNANRLLIEKVDESSQRIPPRILQRVRADALRT